MAKQFPTGLNGELENHVFCHEYWSELSSLTYDKDIIVLDSEYEASQLMESVDRPYLVIQGQEATDLTLAYQSPTYRNTLVFDVPEHWDYF